MQEAEFIQAALTSYREALSLLPKQFAAAQRKTDRQIDLLCEEAGIMGRVQAERDALTNTQKHIQQQADLLSGRINMLEEIHRQFYLAPIPDGVTHKYGIALADLDPETRLKVMHGQEADDWKETITALGGDPDFPDWDGTWEPEEDKVDEHKETEPPKPPPSSDRRPAWVVADWQTMLDPAEDDEPGPRNSDLDEIELAEIESRIESGNATKEDLQRATEMLARTRAAEG